LRLFPVENAININEESKRDIKKARAEIKAGNSIRTSK